MTMRNAPKVAKSEAAPAVGCDITEVADIRRSIEEFGDRYLGRVFTVGELRHCAGDVHRLAARFAAKEAVIKLFRDPSMAFPLTDIEVTSDDGLPGIQLHGAVASEASRRHWTTFTLSLSHADCHAMAVVATRP